MKILYLPLIIIIALNIKAGAQTEFDYLNSNFKDVSGKVRSVYSEAYNVKEVNDSLVPDSSADKKYKIDRLFGGSNENYLVFDKHRRLTELYADYNLRKKKYKYKAINKYDAEDKIIFLSQNDSMGKPLYWAEKRKGLFGNWLYKSFRMVSGRKRLEGIYRRNKRDSMTYEKEYEYEKGYKTTRYFYNATGKKTKVIETLSDEVNIMTCQYTRFGKIEEIKVTGEKSYFAKYFYDTLQNLVEIKANNRVRKYDINKNLIEDSSGNNITYWKYDGKNVVDEINLFPADFTPVFHFIYYYDTGNIRYKTEMLFYNSFNNSSRKEVDLYNARNETIQTIKTNNTGLADTTNYFYDNNNLTEKIISNNKGESDTIKFVYEGDCFEKTIKLNNAGKRDTTINYHICHNDDEEICTYDSHGNWIREVTYTGGKPTYLRKRVITYYR